MSGRARFCAGAGRQGFATPWLLALLLLCLVAAENPAQGQAIALEPVVAGLERPVAVTHAGDGSERLFITLQSGRIVIHAGNQLLATPFLDIEAKVSCCGEQGLLSAAFHPDYANNGQFYVNYTDLAGDTVIARYTVSADANIADAASEVVVLSVVQPFVNHNGGQLKFGPDGFLYVGMGDGGSGGDPGDRAQDLGDLLGKMLRIDVDGGPPYAIPADNPFVGVVGAREEIWAYGLRNPWRFSFDRLTGDLFVADVGQGTIEEVDFQPATSSGGENYGWQLMEGNLCFNPPIDCDDGSLVLPILEYEHLDGNCSITGGYRYRGSRYPQLNGFYFYADFCSGRIWGASRDGSGEWGTVELLDSSILISTFGEDEAGELYLVRHNFNDGTVYRIVPTFPLCDIELNQASYTAGETITTVEWRLANAGPDALEVELKAWLEIPGESLLSLLNVGDDGSLVLPSGLDIDLTDSGVQLNIPVTVGFPLGNYAINCRLLDPTTGATLSLDLNPFEIQ